jgi:hypothetical protein
MIMRTTRALLRAAILAAGCVGLTTSASGQTLGPVSLSFDAGLETSGNGNVHGAGTGTVLGLPTSVQSRSYGDVFGDGFAWSVGLGYRVGPGGELRVSGGYTKQTPDRLEVGNVAGLPLFGQFGDYSAFRMDAGYRQYFGANRIRPYVGGSAGFVRLAEAAAEFSVPAANVTLSDVGFLEASTVPAIGFGAGLQIGLTPRTAFQTGIDFRWHGAYADRDGLAGTGLEPINDETSRWSMPVTAGLTLRF